MAKYAVSYTGVCYTGGTTKVRTGVELNEAESLDDCFNHARLMVKELFPVDWQRDFMITNEDRSETYQTNDFVVNSKGERIV